MLPKNGEYLVITKSLKDVMTLYSMGISAIAPMSENCFLSESQYNRLKERFKHLILFYDNDKPGLKAMISIKKKFPDVIPMWIPWEYKAKDISDFYVKYKRDKTINLIEEAKGYIKRETEEGQKS
uniref:DNA primase n=1 Tax=CrAss-like virus sp. ctYsL76 TaxID=2826826 RepID=A0A8S5QMF5_9CAUD|nr:MAG TPA: DNA primase [CrAss-like virus sp. ctYsL76]